MARRDVLPNRVTRGNERDLKRWEIRVTQRLLRQQVALFHRKIHLQVSDGVIFGTPVGQPRLWQRPAPKGYTGGRARGGWQTSLDAPNLVESGSIDPGGASTLRKAVRGLQMLKAFGRSFISNPVPYIGELNKVPSHSSQTPGQFVEDTIDTVKAQFR